MILVTVIFQPNKWLACLLPKLTRIQNAGVSPEIEHWSLETEGGLIHDEGIKKYVLEKKGKVGSMYVAFLLLLNVCLLVVTYIGLVLIILQWDFHASECKR